MGILNLQKIPINLIRILKILTLCLFFIFFLLTFLKIPVYNYDFWWHLSTGKYIAETKSLPDKDPFSYTSNDTPSERETLILKGNWLAETIFYKIYQQWNLKGIIILRSILLLLFLFYVFLNVKKQDTPFLISLILLGGVYLVVRTYAGERPQLFTFFIFSVVFYLLEDFRTNRSKKVYLIPLLIMFLSNMHPGYIVCILLITLYLAGEGIRSFLGKTSSNSTLKNLLAVWFLAVILSMLNPNGAVMLKRMFSIHGEHIQGIVEFMPTFSLYIKKMMPINYSYIAFLILSLLSLRYFKKIGLVHMLLLAVFTIMSFVAIRYVIFYMCVSAPILAGIIINLRDEKILENLPTGQAGLKGTLKLREGILNAVVCIIGILLVFNAMLSFAKYEYKADTVYSVPKDAADFLSALKIKGNMFNEYGFGGYLIWRLYPDKKVFIDGRALGPDVNKEYNIIASASEGAQPSWKDFMERYNVSYIIMPPLLPQGSIYPLVEELLDNRDWVLIYRDHLSLIFLRIDSENLSVVKKFAMDKKEGVQTIVIQASARALKDKGNPYPLIALGEVFIRMGRFEDAEQALKMAYERVPDNIEIKKGLEKLKESKESKLHMLIPNN